MLLHPEKDKKPKTRGRKKHVPRKGLLFPPGAPALRFTAPPGPRFDSEPGPARRALAGRLPVHLALTLRAGRARWRHTPCPGPREAAALPPQPSPPSPWKRGARPRRGHADLHAEEGTARPGDCGRLPAGRAGNGPRPTAAPAPPPVPPARRPPPPPPPPLTRSRAARTQYGAILFTDKDEVAPRWRHAAPFRPPARGRGPRGEGPRRSWQGGTGAKKSATGRDAGLSRAEGRLTVKRLRERAFSAALRPTAPRRSPVRGGAFSSAVLIPARTGSGGERGSEVRERGGRRVSPRHGQAPPGPHFLPQAGGRG